MKVINSSGQPEDQVVAVLTGSNVQIPVNISYHESTNIQTHNAVSVPLNGNSQSSFYSSIGWDKIAGIFKTDANHAVSATIGWSNDGVSIISYETAVNKTATDGNWETPIKAPYFKILMFNNDATLAHTMSTWIMLKA